MYSRVKVVPADFYIAVSDAQLHGVVVGIFEYSKREQKERLNLKVPYQETKEPVLRTLNDKIFLTAWQNRSLPGRQLAQEGPVPPPLQSLLRSLRSPSSPPASPSHGPPTVSSPFSQRDVSHLRLYRKEMKRVKTGTDWAIIENF